MREIRVCDRFSFALISQNVFFCFLTRYTIRIDLLFFHLNFTKNLYQFIINALFINYKDPVVMVYIRFLAYINLLFNFMVLSSSVQF